MFREIYNSMNLLLDHLVQIVGETVKRTQSCNLDARLTTMTREVVAVGVVCGWCVWCVGWCVGLGRGRVRDEGEAWRGRRPVRQSKVHARTRSQVTFRVCRVTAGCRER